MNDMRPVPTKPVGRQMPRGTCYCGCGQPTIRRQAFFLSGHDRIAMNKVAELYGGTAEMAVAHGIDQPSTK